MDVLFFHVLRDMRSDDGPIRVCAESVQEQLDRVEHRHETISDAVAKHVHSESFQVEVDHVISVNVLECKYMLLREKHVLDVVSRCCR